jgi:hypothetical protein
MEAYNPLIFSILWQTKASLKLKANMDAERTTFATVATANVAVNNTNDTNATNQITQLKPSKLRKITCRTELNC